MPKSYHYLSFKWHVVSEITDSDKTLFVVKRWRKEKQRWHYEVLTKFMFEHITQQ